MNTMPDGFTAGVDTHLDVRVVAVPNAIGGLLGVESFAATAAGYRQLLAWLRSFGDVVKVGVEGTGSYGAGLTRVLLAEGIAVVEVDRPTGRCAAGVASPIRRMRLTPPERRCRAKPTGCPRAERGG